MLEPPAGYVSECAHKLAYLKSVPVFTMQCITMLDKCTKTYARECLCYARVAVMSETPPNIDDE